MYVSTATVKTRPSSRYLQQLCKHWSHRFEVSFGPDAGEIAFGGGDCMKLSANEGSLKLTVVNRDQAAVEAARSSVEEHIVRFAFREKLDFKWTSNADSV